MSAISFRFTRVFCAFLLHAPTARCKTNLANVPTHVVVSPTTCQQTKAAGGIRGMVGGYLQGHAEDRNTGEIIACHVTFWNFGSRLLVSFASKLLLYAVSSHRWSFVHHCVTFNCFHCSFSVEFCMSLRLFIAFSLSILRLYNPTTCSCFVFALQINCLSFVASVGHGILI